MIGKLKVFQYIRQRIQSTSRGGIYLGLHGGTEVAVRIFLSAQGSEEKKFLDRCGDREHLLKLFQFEKERGYMYLCFPLWEKNLEEHLQDPEDEKDYKGILKMIFQAVSELHSLGFAHQALRPSNFLIGCFVFYLFLFCFPVAYSLEEVPRSFLTPPASDQI